MHRASADGRGKYQNRTKKNPSDSMLYAFAVGVSLSPVLKLLNYI
jgi:hypothetical protein